MNPDADEATGGAKPTPPLVWLALALIVVLAGAMRFVGLENRPNGFFRDEAEKGYNAWALSEHGGVIEFRSETPGGPVGPVFGRPGPFVNVMGSQTPTFYHNTAGHFIKAFGLSVRATRMPAALAGTLAVALLGMIMVLALKPARGLTIALWLALCPWHYVFSRWAQQGIFVTVFITPLFMSHIGLRQSMKWAFPMMGVSLGCCFYLYTGTQPCILLLSVLLAWHYWREAREMPKWAGLGMVAFLSFVVPIMLWTFLLESETRLSRVAVWNAPDATLLNTAGRIAFNWIAHYNPIYLFVQGDALARHGVPGLGQLLLVDAVLLPLGIYTAFKQKLALRHELLFILIAAPAGAAITWEHIPHALRSIPMVIPCAAFSGIGLVYIFDALKQYAVNNKRGLWLGWSFACILIAYAVRIFFLHWQMSASDPRYLDRDDGFSNSYATAFAALGEEARRNPQAQFYLDARIPYAPYYYLYYTKTNPVDFASDPTSVGLHLYDPQGRIAPPLASLQSGASMIGFDSKGEAVYIPSQLQPTSNAQPK